MIEIGVTRNQKVGLDVAHLVETRLLITANSGAGKSWALRRLLERSHGHVQQIVLDMEGEFGTLRERFPEYILCGKGGDVPADPKSASLLAKKLLELRVSAICDVYELKAHERIQFVRLFLESLIAAPKALWHPVLVVVDEAHHFCPQAGQAESAGAVIDLATRGRKRGLCAVLATQRLAKLHKDATAELLNNMVGRINQDIDQKRAGDILGFSGKDDVRGLRDLEPGEFHAFGPAWRIGGKDLTGVERVKVGPVVSRHPKVGDRMGFEPAAPTEKIKKVLAELADLPAKAEKDRQTLDDLKRELANARREITVLKQGRPEPCSHGPELKAQHARIVELEAALDRVGDKLSGMREDVNTAADVILGMIRSTNRKPLDASSEVIPDPPKIPLIRRERREGPPKSIELDRGDPALRDAVNRQKGELAAPQQKVLDCLYELRQAGIVPANRKTVAAHSGYSPGGGAFNNILGRLRSMELVSYPDSGTVAITAMGMLIANLPTGDLTGELLRQSWLSKVSAPQQKILSALIDMYPADISREELAERSGYAEGGGAFNNYVGRLCTLGAAVKSGAKRVRASDLLFPEGLS